MNLDPDLMISGYEKGWRYQDEVIKAGKDSVIGPRQGRNTAYLWGAIYGEQGPLAAPLCLPSLMEPVLADDRPHILAAEPDGAAAAQCGVARRKHDLFVGAHAHHLLRQD